MDLPDLVLDPCGRAVALRSLRDGIALGDRESQIRTRTFDNEREVRFAKPDMNTVAAMIREAEEACAALTGAPNVRRRFAMRGGSFGDGNPPYGV